MVWKDGGMHTQMTNRSEFTREFKCRVVMKEKKKRSGKLETQIPELPGMPSIYAMDAQESSKFDKMTKLKHGHLTLFGKVQRFELASFQSLALLIDQRFLAFFF